MWHAIDGSARSLLFDRLQTKCERTPHNEKASRATIKILRLLQKRIYLKHKNHAYCSVKCSSEAHSLRMADRENSKFEGTERTQSLCRDEMGSERKRRHQCSICQVRTSMGSPQENVLEVHHIRRECEEQVPENLITLCVPCHRTHHFGALVESRCSTIAPAVDVYDIQVEGPKQFFAEIFSCTMHHHRRRRIPSMT